MRRTFRLQWQVFRQMDFQQPSALGNPLYALGSAAAIPVMSDSSPVGIASELYDVVSVSITSVGFDEYFSIPYGSENSCIRTLGKRTGH